MGLFDKLKAGINPVEQNESDAPKVRIKSQFPQYFEERNFIMPCTPAEALQAIVNTQDHNGGLPFGAPYSEYQETGYSGTPPLMETIYVTECSDNGMVLAAGNRVTTYWKMELSLVGENPTHGTFKAIEFNQDRWFGNVQLMVFAIERALRSVGGSKGKRWPKR